jgi:hypothetical protein
MYSFTNQSINHEHCICLVIMLALGNDIPQLAFGSITRTNLNEIQVCTEVSRQLIDEEALSGWGLLISIGFRHERKHTIISVPEKARVAVLSLCWASSKAAVFKAVTVRASIAPRGEAKEKATEERRRESVAIMMNIMR